MAVDGLWMSIGEAAQVKVELEARGTKNAKALAREVSMPSSRNYRYDNANIFQKQREVMQHALDVLQMQSILERDVARAIDILKQGLGQ